eukprot:8984813-Alexandrium_andersonii.AAC.1
MAKTLVVPPLVRAAGRGRVVTIEPQPGFYIEILPNEALPQSPSGTPASALPRRWWSTRGSRGSRATPASTS